MTDSRDTAFLKALDRLVARYGAGPTTGLAQLLRDPERTQELANALEKSAARVPRADSRPRAKRIGRVGMALLKELRASDPEKHALIAEVRHLLIEGAALPTMDLLRDFAFKHNLSIGKASSRTAAIAPFLRSLSQLTTSEIISLRDSMIQYSADDRSLERWREVIVRPLDGRTGVERNVR